MNEQPRSAVKGIMLLLRNIIDIASEQFFDRDRFLLKQAICAIIWRKASFCIPFPRKISCRKKFGETFNIPGRIRNREIADHEVMSIFVKQYRIGIKVIF